MSHISQTLAQLKSGCSLDKTVLFLLAGDRPNAVVTTYMCSKLVSTGHSTVLSCVKGTVASTVNSSG